MPHVCALSSYSNQQAGSLLESIELDREPRGQAGLVACVERANVRGDKGAYVDKQHAAQQTTAFKVDRAHRWNSIRAGEQASRSVSAPPV